MESNKRYLYETQLLDSYPNFHTIRFLRLRPAQSISTEPYIINIPVKPKNVIRAPQNIKPTALAKLLSIFRGAAATSALMIVVLFSRAKDLLYSSANIDWLMGYPAA